MALNKQMEMFEDGGLKDEGGTVDPVSGNDVPSGSTQEEVRDDIPAQLSEGEFVFPADVVRFIGLGNLMRIRQEAKMGLKQMEAMGQMGNSDEATMPDDLPFDINDIDMEDDGEYNDTQEFAVGGMPNPNTGVYFNPAAGPTTGVAATPTQAASQTYVQQPQQAAVPTMQAYQASEVPTFQQTLGDDAFGTYDELRQYTNEAGNILNVPFRNGQPISPIPEGYTFVDPEATKTEEVVTTPTQTQSTSVRNPMDEGDGEFGGPEYATTDVSGIGYDRSKLSDSLREVLSNYGTGLGVLGDTFGKAGLIGVASSIMDKDPRVATSSVTSSSLGGVFDAFRGVTDRTGGRYENQRSYSNTTELHNLAGYEQDRLARIANTTVKNMESFFKDKDGKGISADKAKGNMVNALATKYGLSQKEINKIANRGGNFNQINKLARALSEKIAADTIRAEEIAIENAVMSGKATKAVQDAYFAQTGEQDKKGEEASEKASSGSFDAGDIASAGGKDQSGFTSDTGYGVGAKGGLFQKDKMTFHKQMKQSGLASK